METKPQKKYKAFISYRHADNLQSGRQWASWLHHALETYEIPLDLVGKPNLKGEPIPQRIFPVFRDEDALPADANLSNAITRALDDSDTLIVLCSPNATNSKYVCDEVDYFKKQGHSEHIIAAIIDGEPNSSVDDSKQNLGFSAKDECFPAPLQRVYDTSGKPTDTLAEPIAADFRITLRDKKQQGWTNVEALSRYLKSQSDINRVEMEKLELDYEKQLNLMLLKIVAGVLAISLDDLTQRDKEYQLQQARNKAKVLRRWLTGVALLATVAILTGVYAYNKQLEAEQSRHVAEINEDVANQKTNQALIRESQVLEEKSNQLFAKGRFQKAALLAMEGLPQPYALPRPEYQPLNSLLKQISMLPFRKSFRQFPLTVNRFLFGAECNSYSVDQLNNILQIDINTNQVSAIYEFDVRVRTWGKNSLENSMWVSLSNGDFFIISDGQATKTGRFTSPVIYFDESADLQLFRLDNMSVVVRDKNNQVDKLLDFGGHDLGSAHIWGNNIGLYLFNEQEFKFDVAIFQDNQLKLNIDSHEDMLADDAIYNSKRNELAIWSGMGKNIKLTLYSLETYNIVGEISIADIEKLSNFSGQQASGLDQTNLISYQNEHQTWSFDFLINEHKFTVFLDKKNNISQAYSFEDYVLPYDISLDGVNSSLGFPDVFAKGNRVIIGSRDSSQQRGYFYEHETEVEQLQTCHGIVGSLSQDGELVVSNLLKPLQLVKHNQKTYPKFDVITSPSETFNEINSWPTFDWKNNNLYTVSSRSGESAKFNVFDLSQSIHMDKVMREVETNRHNIFSFPLQSSGYYSAIFTFSQYIVVHDVLDNQLYIFDGIDYAHLKTITLPGTPKFLPELSQLNDNKNKSMVYFHFDNDEVYKLDERFNFEKQPFGSSVPVVEDLGNVYYANNTTVFQRNSQGNQQTILTAATPIIKLYKAPSEDFLLMITADRLLTKISLKDGSKFSYEKVLDNEIGDYAFSAQRFAYIDSKSYLNVIDLSSMQSSHRIWLNDDSTKVRFTDDDKLVLVFSDLGPIQLYDLTSGRKIYTSDSADNHNHVYVNSTLDAQFNRERNTIFVASSTGVQFLNVSHALSPVNLESFFESGNCVSTERSLSPQHDALGSCNCLSKQQRQYYVLTELDHAGKQQRRCD